MSPRVPPVNFGHFQYSFTNKSVLLSYHHRGLFTHPAVYIKVTVGYVKT